MTTIDVDTSPLQAAREWRGIGRVAAALSSGLPMAQAEALEGGDAGAFDSVDEMIAAAVVYGASLGIGRDEAMALLDRTVSRSAELSVEVPQVADTALPAGGFSAAVRERSARMESRSGGRESTSVPLSPLAPEAASLGVPREFELPRMPIVTDEPGAVLTPSGPTPEQAVEASQELHLGAAFAAAAAADAEDEAAAWGTGAHTGELEAWAGGPALDDEPSRMADLRARVADGARSGLERVLGTDRADHVADWAHGVSTRTGDALRSGRERLRRSEHATLIVAIGAGAVMIALLVAIGGALGGGEDRDPAPRAAGPVTSPPMNAEETPPAGTAASKDEAADTTKSTPAAKPAVRPLVGPAKLRVNVYNAGSRKGYAHQVANNVKGLGYRVGTVGNARGQFSGPTIVYPAGFEREAKILSRRVGVTRIQSGQGAPRELMLVVA